MKPALLLHYADNSVELAPKWIHGQQSSTSIEATVLASHHYTLLEEFIKNHNALPKWRRYSSYEAWLDYPKQNKPDNA